jgi:hypothetical protein
LSGQTWLQSAGGRYRFRFIDGHWHAGLVVALQHVDSLQQLETGAGGARRQEAVVRFLHPTQRSMLGGVQLPASALQVLGMLRTLLTWAGGVVAAAVDALSDGAHGSKEQLCSATILIRDSHELPGHPSLPVPAVNHSTKGHMAEQCCHLPALAGPAPNADKVLKADVLVHLQPDHDRPHDVTRLAPGDTVYAHIGSGDGTSAPPGATGQTAAGGHQNFDGGTSSGQLWEDVTILSFQHGGHAAQVAATADAGRTATVAVDDLVLTPFADDPSGSDSGPASDGGGDSDGDADMRPGGGGASSRQHDEYQPAPSIPHDGDAELDPVSCRCFPWTSDPLCCEANTLPLVYLPRRWHAAVAWFWLLAACAAAEWRDAVVHFRTSMLITKR